MKKIGMIVLAAVLLTGCTSNVEKGISFLEEKQYKEAVAVFQEEIKDDKNLDEAYRGMAIAYYELKEYEKAAEAFAQAKEHGAEETAVFYSLWATCHLKQGAYEQAAYYYDQALNMEDCGAQLEQEIRFNKIAILEKQSNWEELKVQVEAYAKQYPEDTSIERIAEFLETR